MTDSLKANMKKFTYAVINVKNKIDLQKQSMPCIKNGIMCTSPFIKSMKFSIHFTEGQPKDAYKPVRCMNIHVLAMKSHNLDQ